jgi:hypothetical protein
MPEKSKKHPISSDLNEELINQFLLSNILYSKKIKVSPIQDKIQIYHKYTLIHTHTHSHADTHTPSLTHILKHTQTHTNTHT